MVKKINKKSIGLGLKAGIIASLCCIIPLLLIILGLTSASVALKFVQYKPYFIVFSIIFLLGSIWYFFRKEKKICCPSEDRPNKRWFIATAVGIHLLTFLILLYVLFPTISPFLYNFFSGEAKLSAGNDISNLRQLTLKISGMTCSSCAAGIKYSLERLPEISKAEVSFYSSQAIITYDPNKISPEEIIESEIFSNSSPYQAKIIN